MSHIPIRELFAYGRSNRERIDPALIEKHPNHNRHGYLANKAALDNARLQRRCRNRILVEAGVAIYDPNSAIGVVIVPVSIPSPVPPAPINIECDGDCITNDVISCISLGLRTIATNWIDNIMLQVLLFPRSIRQPLFSLIKHQIGTRGVGRFLFAGIAPNLLWNFLMYGPVDHRALIHWADRYVLATVSKRTSRKRYLDIRHWLIGGTDLLASLVLYTARLWYFQQAVGLTNSKSPFPSFRSFRRYPFYPLAWLSPTLSMPLPSSSFTAPFALFYLMYGLPLAPCADFLDLVRNWALQHEVINTRRIRRFCSSSLQLITRYFTRNFTCEDVTPGATSDPISPRQVIAADRLSQPIPNNIWIEPDTDWQQLPAIDISSNPFLTRLPSPANSLADILISSVLRLASFPVEYYILRTITQSVFAYSNNGVVPSSVMEHIGPLPRWMAMCKTTSKVLLCWGLGLGVQMVTSASVWRTFMGLTRGFTRHGGCV